MVQDLSFFEIGPVFEGVPADQQYHMLWCPLGRKTISDWQYQNEAVTVFDAKADLLSALSAIGVSVDNSNHI